MENHPIPQDVTGFKFKLIGSITVKQFLYLLGFGILATIVFVFQINFLVKLPIMLILAGIGTALAFVPIEGRPMDVMIANFAKTIPAENRFIYRKRGVSLANFEALKFEAPVKINVAQQTATPQQDVGASAKKAQLISRLRNTGFKPDDEETTFLKNINSAFSSKTSEVAIPRITTPPIPADAPPKEIPQEPLVVPTESTQNTEQMQPAPVQIAPQPTITTNRIAPVTKVAPESVVQKTQEYQFQSAIQNKPVEAAPPPPAPTPEPIEATPVAPPPPPPQAGFPSLPDIGNVVLGLVRDPRGRSLPNILVEVTDSNQTPVRAFKTNALGQFASATPLPNGEYKMSFEDPQSKHEFETIDINLTGEIFNPVEVTSVDSREKLRRELFDNQPAQTA